MQQLNKDTLFSIFEQGDEQVYEEHGLEDVFNNPFVLMGTIIRGLENYELMDLLYKRNYPKEYQVVESSLKYKYFSRLFDYLCRINTSSFDKKYKIGESYDRLAVYNGLNCLRLYFEHYEEYEKCVVIKKYISFLTDN
jgi:hypothetical protein